MWIMCSCVRFSSFFFFFLLVSKKLGVSLVTVMFVLVVPSVILCVANRDVSYRYCEYANMLHVTKKN